jgi:hypothetical protein
MAFDIHELDRLDLEDARAEQKLTDYEGALLKEFEKSPEGHAHFDAYPDGGHWITQFVQMGHHYLAKVLPRMTVVDVEEIVTELFPRKISLFSPDDADDTMPELIALWEYLKREHGLPQADSVLKFLHEVEPRFKGMMNDPSNFGMAKSFFMAGQAAGFDMTREEDLDAFMLAYNASMMASQTGLPSRPPVASGSQRPDAKAKQKRQQAKAARRGNRPRKK